MLSEKETLSVIIPNYNHGHYLKDLLPTLFSQSRPPDEVIIVDDGSTDRSVEIIEQFQAKQPRVHLYKNGINKGVVFSLNYALSKARGTFVTFPSADNFVLPGMYEKSLDLLKKHPEVAICCSDPLYFNEQSQSKSYRSLHLSPVPRAFTPKEAIALTHQKSFCIGNLSHTIIAKKEALLEVGLKGEYFISRLKWHCDFFTWNAIAFRYGFCYLPEGLSMFRESPDSYCQKKVLWPERREVHLNLLFILNLPQNRDLKVAFKKSTVLCEFTTDIFQTLLSSPSHYRYFTPRFTARLLHAFAHLFANLIRRKAAQIPYARKIYRSLKRKINA